MIVAFVIGYTVIALEHPLKINKTATALMLGVLLWVCAVVGGEGMLVDGTPLRNYMLENPNASYIDWLVHSELIHALGEISEILFFLIGAMSIVEIVDTHGGFKVITDKIKTTKKVKLLWVVSVLTFFMSAVLDNLTTSIVMVALLRKLIGDRHDRWFFASMVIVAANAGGAWSPIGDVTTIMLWIAGDVSASNIIMMTLLPSIIAMLAPLLILTFMLKGDVARPEQDEHHMDAAFVTTKRHRIGFLVVGVGGLICVPIFKTITHLPPYIGMLGALSVLWIMSEIVHRHDEDITKSQYSILSIISRIDLPSILFFLGILLAVNALRTIGHLSMLSNGLDAMPLGEPGKYYVINMIIGVLSSIVDNVPLVAGAMGMYHFPTDHYFWEFLAYCAGTGGSILIIGSAAGVAVMGLEKIDFIWYLKHISWLALVGYVMGALFYIGQNTIVHHVKGDGQNATTVEMTEEGVMDYLKGNTFYLTDSQGNIEADGAQVSINFIDIMTSDQRLVGTGSEMMLVDTVNHGIRMYEKSHTIQPGEVQMEIKDTIAYVQFMGTPITVSQSGKVMIPIGENPLTGELVYGELKRK